MFNLQDPRHVYDSFGDNFRRHRFDVRRAGLGHVTRRGTRFAVLAVKED